MKKKYKKFVRKDEYLATKIKQTTKAISENPFNSKLKTHKVNSKFEKNVFSSRINADLRITWDFDDNQINIIEFLDLGGHSGKNSVY